jgi:hypothetical protein
MSGEEGGAGRGSSGIAQRWWRKRTRKRARVPRKEPKRGRRSRKEEEESPVLPDGSSGAAA